MIIHGFRCTVYFKKKTQSLFLHLNVLKCVQTECILLDFLLFQCRITSDYLFREPEHLLCMQSASGGSIHSEIVIQVQQANTKEGETEI